MKISSRLNSIKSRISPHLSRPMDLKSLLKSSIPPTKEDISEKDLVKLFRKYKGILKERQRDAAFWAATNDNLKTAYELLEEKERELAKAYGIIQDDLSVASRIQQALLPHLTPSVSKVVDLAVYHTQLSEVGGDYYDFFQTQNGGFAIGVFDISGHGVAAALVMAYLKAQFTQMIGGSQSPREIVEWVNERSYDFLKSVKKYATVNFVVFENNTLRYVCGGGFGLLLHDKEKHLFKKRDNFIGLREEPFHEHELPFERGDTLVLYTDGMVESQDQNGKDYTVKRLNRVITENVEKPVKKILDLCLKDYENFREKEFDDITLVILRKRV